jgi:uncharacterized protein (TIGR02145 family)
MRERGELKRNHMKKILILSIFIFGLINVYSQTQITLTFTAKDSITQNPVTLDSVYVKNLDENCDTLLYGPAPVLTLLAGWPVGIGEKGGNSSEAFILNQNYPNPFQGCTYVSIYRGYKGPLNLVLYDLSGVKLAEYHNGFEKGSQSFVISSSVNGVLILAASDDKNWKSLKIISTGQGNEYSTIQYLEQTHNPEKSSLINPNNSGFIFYLGNQMMYTGYASGYHDNTKFDAPTASTTYIFTLTPLTIAVIPTVTTAAVTNITQTTATSGGTVTSDGGATVTARGVCWNTSSNPTTTNSHTTDGSGTGTFVSNLTGLTANTLYYLRAYATNSVGTAYGNELTFTTLPNLTLPTVTTTTVTNIAQTTATSGGDVTSDGGATVTARGVCWNTSSNPTTANSHTSDGSGTGIFVSNLTGLTPNTLYYVRAYATNSVGTSYGSELTFTTLTLSTPTVTTAAVTNITQTTATSGGNVTSDGGATVTARGVCWNTSSNPTTANSHTSDGSGTGTFVSNLTGLTPNTLYYVRAYATNSLGTSYGNEVTFTTLTLSVPTVTTADVTNITQTTATSGGTVTSDGGATVTARGVCWNTSPSPTMVNSHTTDGSGTGTFVSNLTGLTLSTLYYVRSYATNSVGTAYGNEVSFTTLGLWSCGSQITIYHLASGGVAPVDKTVTYGTVTNIPGETSKCWITSNLGADHQATTKDDTTEASAGWYWQFNRMQGYKMTNQGNRTPNTTWINPINENLDWQSANDPCALEMGNGWRLPTYTEWNDVFTSGGWTDWNGPWNSNLKLHAAGWLYYTNGNLENRGNLAHFWSNTQYSTTWGWNLTFWNVYCNVSGGTKAAGLSLRCIKD